jgi:hypothetical protein
MLNAALTEVPELLARFMLASYRMSLAFLRLCSAEEAVQ